MIGLIFAALSDKKLPPQPPKWKAGLKSAEKAEFTGDKEDALKYYKATLYELKNWKPKTKDGDLIRGRKIDEIQAKINKFETENP